LTRKKSRNIIFPSNAKKNDKLISVVIQEEGETNSMEWSVNEKGELDLYEEDC
jgi:hypothetical protein